MEELIEDVEKDLNQISQDLNNICDNIKSSSLTNSTVHLLDLIESISKSLSEKEQ